MLKWKKYASIFGIGAVGYSLIEIACRGHTHWTMTLTGGGCAVALYKMHRRMRNRHVLYRCGLGALIITAAELGVGLLVNRLLKWNVWDYSDRFMNVLGQICPRFTGYWFLLNIPLVPLFSWLDKSVFSEKAAQNSI